MKPSSLLQNHRNLWHSDNHSHSIRSEYEAIDRVPIDTEFIEIVKDGDLILRVLNSSKGCNTQFRIWSQVLRNASTVFYAWLSRHSDNPTTRRVRLGALDASRSAIMSLESDDVDAAATYQVLLLCNPRPSPRSFRRLTISGTSGSLSRLPSLWKLINSPKQLSLG